MYGYIGAIALILVVGVGLVLSLGRFSGSSSPRLPPFAYPGRETDLRIVVRTSDERALRDALAEFGASYGAADFATAGVALTRSGDRTVVRFPLGLRADHFLFLVNFLHYPFSGPGFPDAYGVASVEPALAGLGLPESLGTVVVFVPEDDDERDAVWLRTPSDETWHFSFQATRGAEPASPRGPAYRDYWLA